MKLIYKKLYDEFGPQHWWPAESPFEVMVGAVLTQNTNWNNVEKAIGNLKARGLLDPVRLRQLPRRELARLIRPSGYYNIKSVRLKEFLVFFLRAYQGKVKLMRRQDSRKLRRELLRVKGIGKETADSILLYALQKPVFVVDAYTKRILSRHGLLNEDAGYDEAQSLFLKSLPRDARLFNEFHALLVKLGKDFCQKRRPKCQVCPLK